jgi:UTP:GlnB (protein PII) uridylyltransferase
MDYIGAGYWNSKKQKLLKKYNNLTDKDLSYNEGNEKEMMETLSKKLGKTKQELLKLIVLL